ncbi:Hypothetical predicted protein [Olea europaea subsp. europaea]|uniref:Uncharacterized protein n=1 Tax=Olea europaea subsp. europaea TaxID=158383 RepID=A0A8S0U3B7_OLEEU|nr:Hypothetical predicted protein [Olea europaea subsp. europaea]
MRISNLRQRCFLGSNNGSCVRGVEERKDEKEEVCTTSILRNGTHHRATTVVFDSGRCRQRKVLESIDAKNGANYVANKDDADKVDVDAGTLCMEDKLRSLEILGNIDPTFNLMLD